MKNPYLDVAHKQRQRISAPPLVGLLLVISSILAYIAQPALLHFVGSVNPIPGVEGLAFRLGALVGAALSLSSYHQIIRTPERAILGPHPIQPELWFASLFRQTLQKSILWPLVSAALAWPMLLHGLNIEFLILVLVVCISWAGMLGVGYATHLASVWAARSEQMHGILDAIRGNNPREQAAFIYAPGFALFVCGFAIMLSASSIDAVIAGQPLAFLALFLPVILGIISYPIAKSLAHKHLVPASAVLAEVDARWAALDASDEEDTVYLEWLAGSRIELLRALRHGWRDLRIWPLGAWLLGFFAFVQIWTKDVDGALLFSGLGALIMCVFPVILSRRDPQWLDEALGIKGTSLLWARMQIAVLYAQGAIVPVAIFAKHTWQGILLLELLVALGAFLSAYVSVFKRKKGLLIVLPTMLCLSFVFLYTLQIMGRN